MTDMTSYKCPVFIIGAMNRCGTNYLEYLLKTTNIFERPYLIDEDYFLYNADKLDKYILETTRHWNKKYSPMPEDEHAKILSAFGDVWLKISLDKISPDKTPVFKTPHPNNIHYLPLMFPYSKLLIIMRDGRDVVESAARTFKYAPHKYWMKQWACGVREIYSFMDQFKTIQNNWKYVKYEDLYTNTEETLYTIFEFLGVETSKIPWDKINNTPIIGSSTETGNQNEVHWQPVKKTKSFNPLGRWVNWNMFRKMMFKRIAGAELIQAGYVVDHRW